MSAPPRSFTRTTVWQALVTVAVLAAGGAGGGWLWLQAWDPPVGVVSEGRWFRDTAALAGDADGTVLYVLIASVLGFMLAGLLAWLLDRTPLVSLAAVTVGAAVAAWLMLQVGLAGSPPNPERLAARAADGTELAGRLHVSGRSPYVAFPLGALTGLVLVYVLLPSRVERHGSE